MRRYLLAVILVLSIAACGVVHYAEPTAEPAARVRFLGVGIGVGLAVLRQYDDSDCRTGQREVARFSLLLFQNHSTIGIPLDPDLPGSMKTEIRVRAGLPFVGTFVGDTDRGSCRRAFAFMPREGQDYEVTYRWDYPPLCTVTLSSIGHAAPNVEEPPNRRTFVRSRPVDVALPPGRCEHALGDDHPD